MEINQTNYYSNEADAEYFSSSQIKSFLECEARTMAEIRGEYTRPTSQALLVGSYVDSYFEGSLDAFLNEHPECFKKDGTLKAEYLKAEDMIKKAEADPVFMEYMQGEKQKVLIGELDGFPFKAKLDVYNGERIVDLKTTRDFNPGYVEGEGRLQWWEVYKYDLQLAIYQKLEGNKLPTYLAAVTKEDPCDIGVFEMPQAILDSAWEVYRDKLPRFDAIKKGVIEPKRCEKCAYCRATRKLTGPVKLTLFDE